MRRKEFLENVAVPLLGIKVFLLMDYLQHKDIVQ